MVVIKAFKGVRATARVLGKTPGAISLWKKTGLVPSRVQKLVLEKAKELNLELTAHDIIYGK